MFKIGEFSCFTRVSIKMLRHYDEINLLRPAYTDPETGYRYYLAEQLPRLNRIILFKDLGFSLEQIAQLLNANLSTDEARGVLKLKQQELQQRILEDTKRLSHLELALTHLDESDSLPPHAIIIREVIPQKVASLRRWIDPEEITPLFDQLEAIAAQHSARSNSPPLIIYHDSDFDDECQDIEIIVPLTKPIPAVTGVHVGELPGGTMACIVYTGDYDYNDALLRWFPAWLEANDYQIAGPLREVYLRFGADNNGYILPDTYLTNNPAKFVTELQLPVKAREYAF